MPQTDVPGESLSPTQPFPTHPPPLHPAQLTPDDAWGFTFCDRGKLRGRDRASYRSEGIFTPPSLRGSIEFPGPAGGAELGRRRDRRRRRRSLYVNQMRVPSVVQLIPRDEYERVEGLREVDLPERALPDEGHPLRRSAWAAALAARRAVQRAAVGDAHPGRPRDAERRSGSRRSAPRATRRRSRSGSSLGAPNLGGALVTAGGLVFIGATTDKFFRAFDARTGEEIWTERLPYTANATPITL